MKYSDKKAFTLIELMIAMFVFVVIATFLIPQVSKDAEKQLFATQLLKVQNDLQQAFLVIIARNQNNLDGFCAGSAEAECLVGTNGIGKYLEYNVIFNNASEDDETETDATKNAGKQKDAYMARKPQFMNKKSAAYAVNNARTFQAIYLKDGAYVSAVYDSNCVNTYDDIHANLPEQVKVCGYLEVDLNASKKPNMVGKDIHYFWIHPTDGVVPFGEFGEFSESLGAGSGADEEARHYGCIENQKEAEEPIESLGCTSKVIETHKIDYY